MENQEIQTTEVKTVEVTEPVEDKPTAKDYAKATGAGACLVALGYGLCMLVDLGKKTVRKIKEKKQAKEEQQEEN